MRPLISVSALLTPAAALLLGTGCVSAWGLADLAGIQPCKTKFYYMDADGDGWGDPNAERQEICQRDVDLASGITARNALDCDDSDRSVTGRIDALCPHEFVTDMHYEPGSGAASDWYVGARSSTTELVATIGLTPPTYPLAAEASCYYWGGSLAKLSAGDDKGSLIQALEARLDGQEHYAAWVAISWDPTLQSEERPWGGSGDFRWMEPEDMDPNGNLQGTPESNFPELAGSGEKIDWCSGEPPEVEVDEQGNAYEQQWLQRVALIGTPISSGETYRWCYDSPEAARASGYTQSKAHMICERQAPSAECEQNAADYCDYRTPEEVAELGEGSE